MLQLDEVMEAVDMVERTRQHWIETENADIMRTYNGGLVKCIDDVVEEALGALFEFCEEAEVEKDAWPLVKQIDEFEVEFNEQISQMSIPGSTADPSGNSGLWTKWEMILENQKPLRFPKPEPIPLLMGLRTPPLHGQIAKMYGWYLKNGEPDVERVHREVATPGSEYDAETWVNSREVEYWASFEPWYEGRRASIKATGSKATKEEKRESHETIEQLVTLPGITVSQIQKMKPEASLEEIYNTATQLGIVLEEAIVTHASPRVAERAASESYKRMHEIKLQRQKEEYSEAPSPKKDGDHVEEAQKTTRKTPAETHPEMRDDVRSRVLAMAEEGLRPGQIAAALTGKVPNAPNSSTIGKWLKEAGAAAKPRA